VSVKKVIDCLKRNNNFLITTHTSPEGDALGSQLAMCRLLKRMGKQVTAVNEDVVPYEYRFLPDVDKIQKFKETLRKIKFDCSIIVDCSDLKRCGASCSTMLVNKPVINIDHHISNERFAGINWVEPYASSCSEMVYRIFESLRVPIDRETAILLYTGIMTDTGSFRYSNTSSLTHKIVSRLLQRGVDVPNIYKKIYASIPFEEARLLTRVLPGIKRQSNGKVVWFEIRSGLLKNKPLSFDIGENILTFGRSIKGVEVVALFREYRDKESRVRVNLRSQGKVDVNKIAYAFGGGGHKAASGCTINTSLDRARRMVLRKISESLK